MSGPGVQPGVWREHKNSDGRVYYYNTQTQATQWAKPLELMGPVERALANQPWKEYTAEGGRKYWFNTETSTSSWEMPEVFKSALAQAPQQPPRPTAPTFVAGGTTVNDGFRSRERDDYQSQDRPDRQSGYAPMEGVRNTAPANAEPEYSSAEEAEAAFFKLLRRTGVQPDWTWEKTVRTVARDPQYRAIRDPKGRKAAFEKYVADVRAQEKEKERERQAKLRADFNTMLKSHPDIKWYTRWKTARPIIEGEAAFRTAKSDEERMALFGEYRNGLYKAHLDQEAQNRQLALHHLTHLLGSLNLEPYTRWAEAHKSIQSNERFQGDPTFRSLTKVDVLKAFENHIKALERSFNDDRQKQKHLRARRERQNRDRFIELLNNLKSGGKLKAGTKWMEIHALIEDDPRYDDMLGQPGSTPLDLFWDMVEEEERLLRGKRSEVLDVLDDKRFEITQKTTFDEFASVMAADRRTANIDQESMALIFERIRERVLKRTDEDKSQAERKERKAIDALRSRIKHLEPPVAVGDTWEQVRPRVEKLEEYRALSTDGLRRSAYDKVIRRLKEKEDEHESLHGRRDRDHRDRDHRSSHAPAGRRHRTRTPEVDAYEADRRKAQADRERQYRKSSVTGLSPPPRRERDERDRFDRHSSRQVSSSHYERERREREAERERSYTSRADPRDRGLELDYGDSRPPSGVRRRRESDAGSNRSGRDAKRARKDGRTSRERTSSPRGVKRSRSPAAVAPAPKEDREVRSGSEEGEIEED
ncbi:putative formin binding protein [Trichodelitschia bisporula]|uniref:Putative formin binding protein n=1 Tax=Trichodelitschia bisporula TaxID=703511 RepID=A0A6G1HYW4_9PEZI|nr:putative formin binding protein [Trichodelitschia bisporula]